jgi:hypothetical protein
MQIKALITLHFDGETVKPGTAINLDDKEAQNLIARGFASTDGLSAEDTTPAVETDNGPSLEDVIEVIEMLDPEKDFNKDGTPSVEVIESLLEVNISAALRDQAWEQFQKDREANAS